VPGTTFTRTGAVFAGVAPSSTWTIVGTGSVTAYPGNPCTVSPALWLRRRRSVTFSTRVNSFSGTFHERSVRVDVLVERERPCST
jgi:hypothetical protein